jgi:hypothetical protein
VYTAVCTCTVGGGGCASGSGTFTFTFDGQTTSGIAPDATSADVVAALEVIFARFC